MGHSASVAYLHVTQVVVKPAVQVTQRMGLVTVLSKSVPSSPETGFSDLVIRIPSDHEPVNKSYVIPYKPVYKTPRQRSFYHKFMMLRAAGLPTTEANLDADW